MTYVSSASAYHSKGTHLGISLGDMLEASINAAIQKGYFRQVRYLVQYKPSLSTLNISDPVSGRSPLCQCVFIDDQRWGVGLAYILMENGAKVSLQDKNGKNALHWSASLGRRELTDVFLASLDYDVNTRDHRGNTALHYAAAGGHLECTRSILAVLERYGMTRHVTNSSGMSPADVARNADHVRCSQALGSHVVSDDLVPAERDVLPIRRSSPISEERRQQRHPAAAVKSRARSATPPCRLDANGLITMTGGDLACWKASDSVRNKPEALTFSRSGSPRMRVDTSAYRIWHDDLTTSMPETDWRRELKRMYTLFAFQFGKSFLKKPAPSRHDMSLYYIDAYGITRPRGRYQGLASSVGPGGRIGSCNESVITTNSMLSEFKAAFAISRRLSRRGSVTSQQSGVGGGGGAGGGVPGGGAKLSRRNSTITQCKPLLGSRQGSVVGKPTDSRPESTSESSSTTRTKSTKKTTTAVVTPAQSLLPELGRPASRHALYQEETLDSSLDQLHSIKEHQEIPV